MPFVHLHFVLLVPGTRQRWQPGRPVPGGVQAVLVHLPAVGWCSGKADCLSLSVSLSLSLSLSGAQAEGLECRRLLYLLPTGPDSGLLAGGGHPKAAPDLHRGCRGAGPGARAGPGTGRGADAGQLRRGQRLAAPAPHGRLAGGGRQPLLPAGEGKSDSRGRPHGQPLACHQVSWADWLLAGTEVSQQNHCAGPWGGLSALWWPRIACFAPDM